MAETLRAGSIISYVKLYFCNVKPAGSAAVFFYQVRIENGITHGTFKALTSYCQHPVICAVSGCVVFGSSALVVCNMQVAVVLWLFLLFRVLSSTAENFFSPILTQLSQEMGLPPRFAGGMPRLMHQQLIVQGQ